MIAIGQKYGRLIACVVLCTFGGCRTGHKPFKSDCDEVNHYKSFATDIEYPAVDACIRVKSSDVSKPHDLEVPHLTTSETFDWRKQLELL